MTIDEDTAARIRMMLLSMERSFEERKMFGGLCFMVHGHMAAGVSGANQGGELMIRCGETRAAASLGNPHARLCDFTGRIMKSILLIEPDGFKSDTQLGDWLALSLDFIDTEPPKKKKPAKPRRKKA